MDKKRFLGILLATLFVLSLLPGAQLTTASAEEMAVARAMEAGEVNRSTVSSVSVQFVDAGNVGAFAKAANGGSANVSVTGPVSTTGTPVSPQNPNSPTIANGAVAEATGARSNATAVVGNGVSVDTGYIAYGAVARSVEGGKAGLTVQSGGITASATGEGAAGVRAIVDAGGTASATVTGGVTAEGMKSALGIMAIVSKTPAETEGMANVTVNGDVQAESTGTAIGIRATVNDSSGKPDSTFSQYGGDARVTVSGDISAAAKNQEAYGIIAKVNGENQTRVTVGDITAESKKAEAFGAVSVSNFGGSGTVTVNGDVTVKGTEDGVTEKGENNVTSNENNVFYITENKTFGVIAAADGRSSNRMDISGGIDVDGGEGNATGVLLFSFGGGAATVTVGEDVAVSGAGGIGAEIITRNTGSSGTLEIGGNVTAGDKGLFLSGGAGSTVAVSVKGDVISDKTGLFLTGVGGENGAGADLDILIEGTLIGAEKAIVVNDVTDTNVALTVWKIAFDGNEIVTVDQENKETNNGRTAEQMQAFADAIEANILYIIQLEQPAQGSVTLEGTTQSHGFATAKEGQTVTLKAGEGYTIVNAYNGKDTKALLLKNESGDYYLVVPKGGGVYLTVDTAEETGAEAEPAESPAPPLSLDDLLDRLSKTSGSDFPDQPSGNADANTAGYYNAPAAAPEEEPALLVTGTAADGSTIEAKAAALTKTEELPAELAGEFADAATSEDALTYGTVGFDGLFADAQEETIAVPIIAPGTKKGVSYQVIFSDGTDIHVTCEKDGILVVPFPKEAENLGYVILRDEKAEFAARYHRAIELYQKYGTYADLSFLPYDIQLQVKDFVDNPAA